MKLAILHNPFFTSPLELEPRLIIEPQFSVISLFGIGRWKIDSQKRGHQRFQSSLGPGWHAIWLLVGNASAECHGVPLPLFHLAAERSAIPVAY